jgi:hypothetical protein
MSHKRSHPDEATHPDSSGDEDGIPPGPDTCFCAKGQEVCDCEESQLSSVVDGDIPNLKKLFVFWRQRVLYSHREDYLDDKQLDSLFKTHDRIVAALEAKAEPATQLMEQLHALNARLNNENTQLSIENAKLMATVNAFKEQMSDLEGQIRYLHDHAYLP